MSDYNDGLVPEPCLRLSCGFGQQYASVELGDGTGYVRVTDDLRSEHHEMKRWYDDALREALDENAKLREMLAEENEELAKMQRVIDYLYSFAKACGVDAEDMRELGVIE